MLIAELPNPFGPGKVQVDVDNDKAIAAYRAARGALAEAVLDESLTALTAPKPWLAAETVLGPETAAMVAPTEPRPGLYRGTASSGCQGRWP